MQNQTHSALSQTKNKAINTVPFFIVWSGQLISSIGSGLTAFALGIYAYQLTGSATVYSTIMLAAFLPSLLLKPIGGTLSDRMNRKLLMMIGDLGSAIGLIFIVVMMYLGITALWVIYLGTIISSLFLAFQNPAYKASVTDLVDQHFYAKASGLMQLAESSRYLISPIIAGFLIKFLDIKSILVIDVFTFLIAVFTVFCIRSTDAEKQQPEENQHFLKDLLEGVQYLLRNKAILLLVSIISFFAFFIGLLQALLGPMILSFSSSQVFGISMTVSTTGMLFGSFFIGIFGNADKKIPLLVVSMIINGLFFSLMGVSPNIIIITLFGFLFFLMTPLINTSLDVLIRSNVESYIQGRIWSMISLVSQLGMVIALGIAGYLADAIFNPLLQPDGALASSIGRLIGTGAGRGIGFIFILSGFFVIMIAIIISQLKKLKEL